MLQKELFWFSVQGVPMGFTRVSVEGTATVQESPQILAQRIEPPGARILISRLDLWRAALKLFLSPLC